MADTDAFGKFVRSRWVIHNLVAHPLLVLCPPVGEWLHDRTAPEDPYVAEMVAYMSHPLDDPDSAHPFVPCSEVRL